MILETLLFWTLATWATAGGPGTSAGLSAEGRPIPLVVQGQGPETILFLGAIHGDEPQGRDLVEQLIKETGRRPELLNGRRLVGLPIVNPDGLLRGSRGNVRGVDLNRNFPTRDWRLSDPGPYFSGPFPASEAETQAVLQTVSTYRPSRIVSIHAPLALVNYDGPPAAEDLAQAMARACARPARADVGYPTPGSLGTYYGKELGIPVITLETGQKSTEQVWKRYGRALLIAISYPDAASEIVAWPSRPKPAQTGDREPRPYGFSPSSS